MATSLSSVKRPCVAHSHCKGPGRSSVLFERGGRSLILLASPQRPLSVSSHAAEEKARSLFMQAVEYECNLQVIEKDHAQHILTVMQQYRGGQSRFVAGLMRQTALGCSQIDYLFERGCVLHES